jgi:uncharacterized protein YdhG (YjbR/CyaY superfamily)
MKASKAAPGTIDEYIAGFPPGIQKLLRKTRKTIRSAAPQAEEAIKYQMPTFVLNGNLVHFAGCKNHIGLYPMPSGTLRFKRELSRYVGGKGSVRFPLDEPIPYGLIARIVRFRVKENLQKATATKAKRSESRGRLR